MRSRAGTRAGNSSKWRVYFYSIVLLLRLLDMLAILTRFLRCSFRSLLLGRILPLGQRLSSTGHEHCSVLEVLHVSVACSWAMHCGGGGSRTMGGTLCFLTLIRMQAIVSFKYLVALACCRKLHFTI